jgi:hypothetical protein
MNKIYKNAGHVLAWLGLDPEGLAESAFSLIHSLDNALSSEHPPKGRAASELELQNTIEQNRKALDKLTSLAWVGNKSFKFFDSY